MPALPPRLVVSKPVGAPIGPNLPPELENTRRASVEHDSDSNENEDDDESGGLAGPAPLPAHLASVSGQENEGVTALREREERQREQDRLERESKVPKREEWMLLPPKELDLQATVDPTKIKSRGFKQTSKPHHSSSADRGNSSGSLWTETPSERAQRLADEAVGKRRRAEDTSKDGEDDLEVLKKKKRDRLMRQQVEEHNRSSRNSSLLELHHEATTNVTSSKSKAERELEKKQSVVWDHDTMMGVNSKMMSEKQRADLVKDAKGLGGRFGGGGFL